MDKKKQDPSLRCDIPLSLLASQACSAPLLPGTGCQELSEEGQTVKEEMFITKKPVHHSVRGSWYVKACINVKAYINLQHDT